MRCTEIAKHWLGILILFAYAKWEWKLLGYTSWIEHRHCAQMLPATIVLYLQLTSQISSSQAVPLPAPWLACNRGSNHDWRVLALDWTWPRYPGIILDTSLHNLLSSLLISINIRTSQSGALAPQNPPSTDCFCLEKSSWPQLGAFNTDWSFTHWEIASIVLYCNDLYTIISVDHAPSEHTLG